jgi:protein-S-isoprenylcysteine O-methyltransferase Ste14
LARIWLRAAVGFAWLMIVMALLLFMPAWSLAWWEAWLYWAVFFACSLSITVHFLRADPNLIERRLGAGPLAEGKFAQKLIQSAASLFFVAILVVPSLGRRFGWPRVPLPLALVADGLVIAGFWLVFLVFRENSYASSVIRAESGQRVITTGPYRFVRHPMYSGGITLVLFTPLALGSWWGLVPAILLAMVIVVRLFDEERFLAVELPGYVDYCSKVRYRLIPSVW